MKKIYNYMMLFTLALMAVCCSEEDLSTPSAPSKNGEEVNFGLSLEELSRTIYGSEENNAFPIYWSDGDKVLVASPQCSRQSAEYSVTPVAGQSFAEALTRTGEAGVQWGSTAADFYSVYPSNDASYWKTIEENNVVANLNIASEQSANLVYDQTKKIYSSADMDNVVMYAVASDVANGSDVNLQYTPYSTVLEFEVAVGPVGSNNTYGSAKVMSMTLEAPTGTNITGDFTLKFNGSNAPTITAAGNNGDKITMEFTTQPVLDQNNILQAKMSLIPLGNVKSLEGWKVSIVVLEGNETATKTYTKTLTPEEGVVNTALVPGKIHKIKLPKLTPSAAWTYSLSSWITSLYDYKNIYLTELSIPGAWYAGAPTDDGYQETTSMTTLWNAGIRAFAVECRTATVSTGFLQFGTRVVISGTGQNGILGFGKDVYVGGDEISSLISSIAASIPKDEFGVLVLSYADGGEGGHRDQDHAYFINGIKNEIANSGADNIHDEEITKETTISDVLGKLIIKINVDDNLTKSNYDGSMNALLSYNPFVQQLKPDADETSVDFSKIRYSNLYWKTWEDAYKKFASLNTTDFLWCFSSANRTQIDTGINTSIPTYAKRQEALRSMINKSREITSAGTHNVWFYFNAGGTQTTSQTDESTNATSFATTMNSWLLEVIKLKANGGTDTNGFYTGTKGTKVESDPSSLGLVFFNQCTSTSYNGPAIIKEIIEMNNKFKLQRYTPTPNPDDNTQEGEDGI